MSTTTIMESPAATKSASTPTLKKRKAESDLSSKSSKKKKRHAELNERSEEQTLSQRSDKKEKKRRKKEKHKEIVQDVDLSEPHANGDINMVEAPSPADTEAVDDGFPQDIQSYIESQSNEMIVEQDDSLMQSQDPSCFYEKRLSLQIPIPAIGSNSVVASVLSLHLAPLLLTYFSPVKGIVLSFSDPVLSAKPNFGVNLPLQPPNDNTLALHRSDEIFLKCADEHGVAWVWLTATFLVFHPSTGDDLKGWTNVISEGFIGLVSYNYFQTAVGKSRIPKRWTWDGPTSEGKGRPRPKKGKLKGHGSEGVEDEEGLEVNDASSQKEGVSRSTGLGTFIDEDGHGIGRHLNFRVVDVEMVPGHERNRWTLQIDGSLLSESEESVVLIEERQRFEQLQSGRSRSRSRTPGMEGAPLLMSGDIPLSREDSIPL